MCNKTLYLHQVQHIHVKINLLLYIVLQNIPHITNCKACFINYLKHSSFWIILVSKYKSVCYKTLFVMLLVLLCKFCNETSETRRFFKDTGLSSACTADVKCRPLLHHCVVIFVWSSGIMDCMLFTFPLIRGRQWCGIFRYSLINSFNKTEAVIFHCRLCFLRAFPSITLIETYLRNDR